MVREFAFPGRLAGGNGLLCRAVANGSLSRAARTHHRVLGRRRRFRYGGEAGCWPPCATLEAERIGERTRSVKEHQRQHGLYVGGTLPFGYVRKGQRIVANPEAVNTASRIKQLYEREGMSCRRIADTLREQGIAISHNTVYRIAVGRRKHDSMVASV